MSIQDIVKRAVLALGFEERTGLTAFDSSPKHNNATLLKNNGVLPQWVASKDGFGGALRFDSVGAYASIPDDPSFDCFNGVDVTWTVSIWVKTTEAGGSNYTNPFIERRQSGVGPQWIFHIKPHGGKAGVYISSHHEFALDLQGITTINDGEPHNIIVTKNGALVNLIVDGRLEASGSVSFDAFADQVISIGARRDDGGTYTNFLGCDVDDVLILPLVLTLAECRNFYESRSIFAATPNLRRGLVLDLDLQEGVGTKVFDKSWYANNGAIYPGSGSILNEGFISIYDTPVQLKHTNLTGGTVVVTDNGTTYTEGVGNDYTIDYPNGKITVLSTGTMADDTAYLIDYDYAGSYPIWVPGGGLILDGVDDYIEIPNFAIGDSMSLNLWFKSDETGGSSVLFWGWGIGGGNPQLWIRMYSTRIRVHINDAVNTSILYTSKPYDDGIWHNLCVVKTPTSSFIAMDGNVVASDIQDIGSIDNGLVIKIGARPGLTEHLQATIGKTRIYNRALSPTEVRALYAEGL